MEEDDGDDDDDGSGDDNSEVRSNCGGRLTDVFEIFEENLGPFFKLSCSLDLILSCIGANRLRNFS